MNEQNNLQPNESVQNSKNIWTIIVPAIVIAIIIVSGGVWWWQKSALETERQQSNQEIQVFRQQITQLQNQIQQLSQTQSQQSQEPAIQQEPENPAEKICFDNGGNYIKRDGIIFCVFPNGKECGEFGWNKCVESKGGWQPSTAPPSGND